MKILMTIHHRLERDAGAPGVTLSLADQFRRLGHETTLLSFDDMPRGLPEKSHQLLFPQWVAARLSGRQAQWDVIDASTGDAWLYASLPRPRRRPLLVCRSHGLEHVAHERLMAQVKAGDQRVSWKYPFYHGGFRLWEVARSLRKADLSLVLNTDDYRYAQEVLGVAPARLRRIPNGIPESFLGLEVHPRPALASDPLRIAQIGRYSWMKGASYGSRALNAVMLRHANVHVHFLGTGVDAGTVLRDFDPELHPRVEVTPRFERAALPALLAGYDVKFFPTLSEGFALSLVEAMACGLAPVTTTAAGTSMVVRDRENGLLVPTADADALERALEELLRDRVFLARLRSQALADAQAYSWRDIAARQVALFEEFRKLS